MADVTKILKLITLDLYDKLAAKVSDRIKNIELTPGPQGEKGNTGAAAGFGTVTAKMGNTLTGTPTVSVSTSGSDIAKNFEFTFSNLKGATGERGPTGPQGPAGSNATVTVDSSLNASSSNPVQNKVINAELDNKLPRSGAAIDGNFRLNASNGSMTLESEKTINITSNGGEIILNSDQGIRGNHSGKKIVRAAATLVVGTTKSGHTYSDCDYLCDGTADQVEINNAINALPAGGGKVILLEGTYNISDTISISQDNVTFEGLGEGVRIINSGSAEAIYVKADYCCIKDFYVDGGGNVCVAFGHKKDGHNLASGINAQNGSYGIGVNGSYGTITNCTIGNCSEHGIALYNASSSANWTITNNNISNISGYGISSLVGATISQNYVSSCSTGIRATGSCRVIDNHCSENTATDIVAAYTGNTLIGNQARSNGSLDYSISVGDGKHVVVGNVCSKALSIEGSSNICENNMTLA